MTIKPKLRFNADHEVGDFRGSANYEGTASMAGIGTLAAGQWEEIQATSPDVLTGGTRAIFYRGSPNTDVIDYINISTTGGLDFGNALSSNRQAGATSSETRLVALGRDSASNVIEFVTIASTGDAQDFGDAIVARNGAPAAMSNGTRGIFAGGGDLMLPILSNILPLHRLEMELILVI